MLFVSKCVVNCGRDVPKIKFDRSQKHENFGHLKTFCFLNISQSIKLKMRQNDYFHIVQSIYRLRTSLMFVFIRQLRIFSRLYEGESCLNCLITGQTF